MKIGHNVVDTPYLWQDTGLYGYRDGNMECPWSRWDLPLHLIDHSYSSGRIFKMYTCTLFTQKEIVEFSLLRLIRICNPQDYKVVTISEGSKFSGGPK